MPDFIDAIRSGRHTPAPARASTVYAFDPDLRTIGWAVIAADGDKPSYYRAGLIRAKNEKLTSLAQVESMISGLVAWLKPLDILIPNTPPRVIIEAQEFYSRSRVDANDLIRLAQVTGALQAHLTTIFGVAPETVLPRKWKGQKSKTGMHKRVWDWLATANGETRGDLDHRYGENDAQHAFDALCMAKWGLSP